MEIALFKNPIQRQLLVQDWAQWRVRVFFFQNKESRLMRSPCSLCGCECLNQSLWNLVCTYGNWAHHNGNFIIPSQQSAWLHV
jgi:hypothetical protein